jgi:hypothetical protein
VQLAHRFALECDRIVADMVEVTEFPHLAQRYGVLGVPKTVANEYGVADGLVPEDVLLGNILAISNRSDTAGRGLYKGGNG